MVYVLVTSGLGSVNLKKIIQRYAYHAALAKLEQQGFTLANETQEKGRVHLVLRRMA
jgi:hypothetical protein